MGAIAAILLGPALLLQAEKPTEVQIPQSDPVAVAEVESGKRSEANAAWWGFDPEDSTAALQGAIDSGAKRVIVPNVGQDWVVRPLRLASHQELVLEPGVVIAAKRGEYRGKGDSVLTARDVSHLVITGYGATIRMHKEDYIVGTVLENLGWNRWYGPYPKAEWRMALSLHGCSSVAVRGLTLRDSGGDGIYIAGLKSKPCRDIEIKDVVCDNNYRQGMSIISVEGLRVENSIFRNTWGTPPSAGVDIEPDDADEVVRNVTFRDCRFEDNYGDGIEVFLPHVKSEVSILFEDCLVTSRRGSGIRVSKLPEGGPTGTIEFRRCRVEKTEAYGIKVQDKVASAGVVRFVECTLRDVARDRQYAGAWAPLWLQSKVPSKFGGIEFVECVIEDDRDRAPIVLESQTVLDGITGTITVRHPRGPKDVPPIGAAVRFE